MGNTDAQQLQQECWATQPLAPCGPGPYLAGVNAHVDSCAISLLALHPFNVDDVFLPVNLDYFANLLPFVVPSYNLNANSKVTYIHIKEH